MFFLLLIVASIRASAIPNTLRLAKDEYNEYQAFMDWLVLRKDMISSDRDWGSMNSSDLASLEMLLLKSDTYAASQAMQVLNEYGGKDYFMPPAYGQSGTLKRQNISKAEISEEWLHVYPNPANFLVTIELKNGLPTTEIFSISVTDLMGRVIYTQVINPQVKQYTFDTQYWASGLYTFSIHSPHSSIELNGKINVQH